MHTYHFGAAVPVWVHTGAPFPHGMPPVLHATSIQNRNGVQDRGRGAGGGGWGCGQGGSVRVVHTKRGRAPQGSARCPKVQGPACTKHIHLMGTLTSTCSSSRHERKILQGPGSRHALAPHARLGESADLSTRRPEHSPEAAPSATGTVPQAHLEGALSTTLRVPRAQLQRCTALPGIHSAVRRHDQRREGHTCSSV